MFRPTDQALRRAGTGAALCLAFLALSCSRQTHTPDLPHAPTSLTPRFYAPPGWAWGRLTLADGQVVRYGVSSPPVVPRGSVLILPDRDEPAEVWFETANDLLSRGLTVWVLESAAGRGPGALDAGKGAISRMVEAVIRAKPDKPLVLVAHGLGATLALRAIGQGQAPGVNGAVLSSPALELARIDADLSPETVESAAEWLSRARAGWIALPGDGQPRLLLRPASGLDPKRAGLAATWRRSDPALKLKTTTFGWVWGYDQGILAARAAEPVGRPSIPVTMAAEAADLRARDACARLSTCTLWAAPTTAPHLARNEVRTLWLNRISDLISPSAACRGSKGPGCP